MGYEAVEKDEDVARKWKQIIGMPYHKFREEGERMAAQVVEQLMKA